MANTNAMWQHDHHRLAAKQVPYQKSYIVLTKNIEEFSGKKSGEWAEKTSLKKQWEQAEEQERRQ